MGFLADYKALKMNKKELEQKYFERFLAQYQLEKDYKLRWLKEANNTALKQLPDTATIDDIISKMFKSRENFDANFNNNFRGNLERTFLRFIDFCYERDCRTNNFPLTVSEEKSRLYEKYVKKYEEKKLIYLYPLFALTGVSAGGLTFAISDHIQKQNNAEQLEQEILEYCTLKSAELNERYPVLELTPQDLEAQLEKVFEDCHTFEWHDLVVKPGYENFFVDYKNTDAFGVPGTIDQITWEVANQLESLLAGVGVCIAVSLLCACPILQAKLVQKQTNIYTKTLEQSFCSAREKMCEYLKNDEFDITILGNNEQKTFRSTNDGLLENNYEMIRE